jgi:hypothetical protein
MAPENSASQFQALLETIESAHGCKAAEVAYALASLQFAIDATHALLADYREAGATVDVASMTLRAVWHDTRLKLQHALIGPLLDGLDPESAALLSSMLNETSRILARMPISASSAVH